MMQVAIISLTIFAISIGIFYYRKLSPFLKVLVYFIILKAVGEIGGNVLYELGVNNQGFYNVYTIASYFLIAPIFYMKLRKPAMKYIVGFSMLAYGLFGIYNFFFLEGVVYLDSYTMTLESFFIIALAIAYMFQVFTDLKVIEIEKDAMFLLSAALLLYFAGSFFLFLFLKQLAGGNFPEVVTYFSIINTSNNSIFTVLLMITLWTGRKQPQLIASK